MQRCERVFKLRQGVSLARADRGPDQSTAAPARARYAYSGTAGHFRVALSCALVPSLVQLGEQAGRGIEPVYRARTRHRHVNEEDPGESRLVGEEREVRPARGPEHLLVASPGGQRTSRRDYQGDHELPALAGRGQEAILLVREVSVEGRPGHPGPPHDVRDSDGRIAAPTPRRSLAGAHVPLLGTDDQQRQAGYGRGKAWLLRTSGRSPCLASSQRRLQ